MRTKPDTSISDNAWENFNELCEQQSIGEHPDDWFAWFIFYEAGYISRMEE